MTLIGRCFGNCSLWLAILLTLSLSATAYAQNKLFISPVKYTDRRVYTYNHTCNNQSQVHFTLNGQPLAGYQFFYFSNSLGFIEFDFGTLKPGDVITVSDDCGSTPYSVTVTDDYIYVEVPGGTSHAGNNIPPGDASLPYSRLSTPVSVGRCAPINTGAHGLHTYGLFVSTTNKGTTTQLGQFLINGAPLATAGHIISHVGYQAPVVYTIGANGSLSFDGPVKFTSQQFYSGQTPLTLEYHNNGGAYAGDLDLDLAIGAMTFRYISNTGFSIQKATYTSAVSQKDFSGDYSQSVFKITYDGQYFRAYVDNVLIDELERFVVFDAQGGSLSNTGVLPYGSSVTFSPTQPGAGWVGVLVDGVLYTRQQFSIADDLSLNPTVVNAGCSGATSGQISVAVTGGKAPFQYNLNGGAYSAGSTFTNLTPATYTVGVRDASGCKATRTVTVSQPPGLSLRIDAQTNVTCIDKADGSITLSPSGGTGPYQYSQNGGAYGTSPTFINLTAGNYSFAVKDGNGCTASVNASLTTQSAWALGIAAQQGIACNGATTGAVSLTITGAPNGTLQYSLNGGPFQPGAQFTGLGAGTYTITAKDNLCTNMLPVTLTQPPVLVAAATVSGAITCFGATNGDVTLSVSGGTPSYQYSADGTSYQTTSQFTGLGTGNYKYWVKDANGCLTTTPILTLSQPSALQLAITDRSDALCFGGATGSLTLAATGGTSPYTYARTGTGFGASDQFADLAAATYTVQARDAGGCLTSLTTTIGQPVPLQGGLNSLQPVTCSGGSDGALSLSATGGTSPYRYSRDGNAFGADNGFSGFSEGNYTLTIRDANGCSLPVQASVTAQSRLVVTIASLNAVGCQGEKTGRVTGSATGSTAVGPLLYSLDGTNYQSSPQFTGIEAGTYTLSLKDNLCQVSRPVVITQPTVLQAAASVIQAVACWGGNSGLTRLSASGGTTPYQYSADGTTY